MLAILLIPLVHGLERTLSSDNILLDSKVRFQNPTTVHGADAIVQIGDYSGGGATFRAYFTINLENFTSQDIIANSTLQLNHNLVETNITISVHFVNIRLGVDNATVDETTLTWNNQWCDGNLQGGIAESVFCNSTTMDNITRLSGDTGFQNYDITDGLKTALFLGYNNLTILLAPQINNTIGFSTVMDTKEAASEAVHPRVITEFNISDITKPTITIITPAVNDSTTNQNPFNFSFTASDETAPNVFCQVENETTIFDTANLTSGSIFNLTVTASTNAQIIEDYRISCLDLEANTVLNIQRLTIDEVNPLITINTPANNSLHNLDISINFECADPLITSFNYSFFNSSDIVQTKVNTTSNNSVSILLDTIDIDVLGSGTYNFDLFCNNGANTEFQFLEIEIDNLNPIVVVSQSSTNLTINEDIFFNTTCADNRNLNLIAIANNESGALINVTTATIGGTSLIYFVNETAELGFISHQFTCEDEAGNSIISSLFSYTGNPIIITPVDVNTLSSFPYTRLVVFIVNILIVIFLIVVVARGFKK